MKLILLLLLTLTGCTTTYKVDSNGVCRALDGKTVKLSDVEDTDAWFNNLGNFGSSRKYGKGRYITPSVANWTYRWMGDYLSYTTGGTCYGW